MAETEKTGTVAVQVRPGDKRDFDKARTLLGLTVAQAFRVAAALLAAKAASETVESAEDRATRLAGG